MKSKCALYVSIISLGLIPFGSSAQSNVTIYGRVDTSLDFVNVKQVGSRDYQRVQDNGSRLGFKGEESLGSGLKAVFGLEMGINADDGSSTSPAYRNSYVGLTGGFGALAMGRLDSAAVTGSPIYSLITANTSFIGCVRAAPIISVATRNKAIFLAPQGQSVVIHVSSQTPTSAAGTCVSKESVKTCIC